jgi:cysteine-rich repeat protein
MVFMEYELYLPMMTSGGDTAFFRVTFDSSTVSLDVAFVGVTDCTTVTTAAFDKMGIFYTCSGASGYKLMAIDFSTYEMTAITPYGTSDNWKLYQNKGANQPNRPVFGVNDDDYYNIYRITLEQNLKYDYDTDIGTLQSTSSPASNFYDYDLQVARYHAMSVQPGEDYQEYTVDVSFNNLRNILVNLRDWEEIQRIDMSLAGCGNGKYYPMDYEQCDDFNLEDGDGCDHLCQVEEYWYCVNGDENVVGGEEGVKSVCTPIICGNNALENAANAASGGLNNQEECDDGNWDAGDGCYNCMEEEGWECDDLLVGTGSSTYCTERCGNYYLDYQTVSTLDVNETYSRTFNTAIYTEICDLHTGSTYDFGCESDCTITDQWTCLTDDPTFVASWTATQRDTCEQTCGDDIVDNYGDGSEECDLGARAY